MARPTKEQVTKELEKLGVVYDANAEYTDLCELLKTSKPAEGQKSQVIETGDKPAAPVQPEESEKVETAVEKAARSQKSMTEAIAKQYSAENGTKIYIPKDLAAPQKLEKTIRAFVCRKGGFRTGLNPAQIAQAKELLKKAGRDPENPAWDMGIALPGYDTL